MRAVIYTRYSAGKGQNAQSTEGQYRECKRYIENQGWDLVGHYADEHISGKTDKRPAFQKMVNAAKKHEFEVVVVYTSDRFSRDKYHAVTYKHQLKSQGIKICYAAENIPDTPEGELLESVMEGLAQYYSAELSRKVKRGMKETALKCRSNGSHRTFGYYTGADKMLHVNEEEAEAVRHIYQMIAEGGTIIGCVNWLNERGYKGTLGRPFNVNSVKHILTNRRYIGYYIFNGMEIPDGVPAIIDKTTFESVQERLRQNTRFMPKNRVEFPLSGKLTCGKCGEPMSGRSGHGRTGKKYSYYACKGGDIKPVPKEALELAVAGATADYFGSAEEKANLVDMLFYYTAEKSASDQKYEIPKKRINELKKKRDNLVDLIAETGNRSLVAKLEEVEEELGGLELRAEEARMKKDEPLTKEQLAYMIDNFLLLAEFDEPDNRNRRIIDALVRSVVYYADHLEITFNIQVDKYDESSDFKTFDAFAKQYGWWTKSKPGRTIGLTSGHLTITKKWAANQ